MHDMRELKLFPPVGTRVFVVDGSAAHGQEGQVWHMERGVVCIVKLGNGSLWVADTADDIYVPKHPGDKP